MEKNNFIKSGQLSDARRDFIKKSGALAAMSMFGLAFFTGCSDDSDSGPGRPMASPNTGVSVSGNTITIDLTVATDLAAAGAWTLLVQSRVLVVNLGNNRFSALTSVCTHSGCDRSWTYSNEVFTCTCHTSRFRTDGTVISGPANRPLASYATTLNNNVLTITIS